MSQCTYGHANPPGTSFCSTCGLALTGEQPPPVVTQPAAAWASAPPQPAPPPPYGAAYAAPPPRRSRVWILPVVLVGVIVLIGAGVLVFQAMKPTTTTVLVTLELYNGSDGCDVGLGYNDVPGASVVISADGVPVGTSSLDLFGSDMGLYCEFTASVPSVPTDKGIYTLTIGGSNRGVLTSTQSELSANGWNWGVTLGD